MKGKLLLLGVVLAAHLALAGEGIGQFAKQSLGLDLTTIPFGEPDKNNGSYVIAAPPIQLTLSSNEQSFSWRANAISKQYHEKFPNRELLFGFRNNRVAAVRITIDAINHMSDENRAELLRFYNELFSDDLSSRVTKRKFPFDDGNFHLKVDAACGLEPHSLFIMEFHIIPSDVKKD